MAIPRNPVLKVSYFQNGQSFISPPIVLGHSLNKSFQVNGFNFAISERENKERKTVLVIVDEKSFYPLFEEKTVTISKTQGVSISFTLVSDFVKKDDYKFRNFLVYSLLIHGVFFLSFGFLNPSKAIPLKTTVEKPVDVTRVRTVLEKIKEKEEKRKIVKVTQKIETQPKKRAKEKPIQKMAGKKKAGSQKPILNEKAAALTRRKAELSKKLGFLSKTAGKFQIKIKDYKQLSVDQYDKIAFNKSELYGAKLTPSRSYDSIGNIQTKGIRSIDQDIKISSGKDIVTDGVRGGHVRGKVKVSDLYGSGGGEIGSSLSIEQGISLSGRGSIPESVIEQILSKHISRLQYCYEKALLSNPALAGTLKIEWTITETGQTINAKVIRSQLASNELHACILKELKKIRFPAPKGGSVIVTKPFSFSSSAL